MPITQCRSCGSSHLQLVLDLGMQPLANSLLTTETVREREARYPLQMLFCDDCAMLQVSETIPPEILYQRDYPYFSSTNKALLAHAHEHVESLIKSYDLGRNSFVIEVASNDGYLLRNFVGAGIPCLGIDPADGPATAARESGVPTIHGFFSSKLADEIAMAGQKADVMIASNVVAHVDQINDFIAGFKKLLKPHGVAVFEFAYALDTIQKNEFDQTYHEHLFYHTLSGLKNLFERHGLHLHDARHLKIHGGSLRLTVAQFNKPTRRLRQMLENEISVGADRFAFYQHFAHRVEQNAATLKSMLTQLKAAGHRIACYGAPTKGATLLNYLDLGEGFFEFTVDQSPHKQGKFMPGQKLAILPVVELCNRLPPYCLILAWNFADDIVESQRAYREAGGQFIVPVPTPTILPALACRPAA